MIILTDNYRLLLMFPFWMWLCSIVTLDVRSPATLLNEVDIPFNYAMRLKMVQQEDMYLLLMCENSLWYISHYTIIER